MTKYKHRSHHGIVLSRKAKAGIRHYFSSTFQVFVSVFLLANPECFAQTSRRPNLAHWLRFGPLTPIHSPYLDINPSESKMRPRRHTDDIIIKALNFNTHRFLAQFSPQLLDLLCPGCRRISIDSGNLEFNLPNARTVSEIWSEIRRRARSQGIDLGKVDFVEEESLLGNGKHTFEIPKTYAAFFGNKGR